MLGLITLVFGLTVIKQTGFHKSFLSINTRSHFRGIIPRAHSTGGTCPFQCYTKSPLRVTSRYQSIVIVKPILNIRRREAKEDTSTAVSPVATYNKTTSFFDNIFSRRTGTQPKSMARSLVIKRSDVKNASSQQTYCLENW